MKPMPAQIFLEIEPEKAWALAQLIKRVGWSEIRANAVNDDEAHCMKEAIGELQKALGDVGFLPR